MVPVLVPRWTESSANFQFLGGTYSIHGVHKVRSRCVHFWTDSRFGRWLGVAIALS
jgi:hypothetical protein